MEFPERLKQLRIARGMTQKELGDALCYGSSAIANYESGRNQPSLQDLIKIAQHLGVTTDYLMGLSNIPYAYLPITPEGLDLMSKILAQQFCACEDKLAEIFRPILREILNGNAFLPEEETAEQKN